MARKSDYHSPHSVGVVLSAPSDNPSNGYAMWVHGSMLHTLHDHAIVVVVDKLEGSGRRDAHRTGAHIHHRAYDSAQPMARCALKRVGGAHQAPSGPRRLARDARVPYLRV